MRKINLFAILLVILGGLSGCTTSGDKESKEAYPPSTMAEPSLQKPETPIIRKHKIALLLPTTGVYAEIGHSLQKAAEMALFEHADQPLELLTFNTGGTAKGARTAALSAVKQGAELLLGPLTAQEVTAVEHAIQHTVPVLAFSNDQNVASPNVFTLGYAPAQQVERLIKYAAAQSIKNIAVLAPQDEYGALVMDIFRKLQNHGTIRVSAHITYSPDHPDHLTNMAATDVQGLFFAEGGKNLEQVLKSLQQQGVKLDQFRLLGSSHWDHPETLKNPLLVGGLYVNSNTVTREDFEEQYKKTYRTRANRLAFLAYDMICLSAALLKRYPQEPFTLKHLTQHQGFSGLEGIFRLKEDGSVERGLAIYEITGTGARIMDPAPVKF